MSYRKPIAMPLKLTFDLIHVDQWIVWRQDITKMFICKISRIRITLTNAKRRFLELAKTTIVQYNSCPELTKYAKQIH